MGVLLVEEVPVSFLTFCMVRVGSYSIVVYGLRFCNSLMLSTHTTCFCNIRSSFLGKCIHFLFYSRSKR